MTVKVTNSRPIFPWPSLENKTMRLNSTLELNFPGCSDIEGHTVNMIFKEIVSGTQIDLPDYANKTGNYSIKFKPV